jgi:hypothetical protein
MRLLLMKEREKYISENAENQTHFIYKLYNDFIILMAPKTKAIINRPPANSANLVKNSYFSSRHSSYYENNLVLIIIQTS